MPQSQRLPLGGPSAARNPAARLRRKARHPARAAAGPNMAAAPEALEQRVLLSTFVVATNGNDAHAGSASAPFRTIQKAANVAQPGDTVLVRGGTYRETVRPARSGSSASAKITFKAQPGERVTVSGADVLTGWTRDHGSVYKTTLPWDLGFGKNQVFLNGHMMNQARWPNTGLEVSDNIRATADRATATSSSATLWDSALTQPDGFWNGATINIIAGEAWQAQTGTVTGYTRGKLTFSYTKFHERQVPTGGNRYYLTGKAAALDNPAEWHRDADGRLLLFTPSGDNPAGHVVEAKRRQYAFDLRDRRYIDVEGFNVFAATITSSHGSGHLRVGGVEVRYPGHFTLMPGKAMPLDQTVLLAGSNNLIHDSRVSFVAGHGIVLDGSNSRAANNVVNDSAYQAGGAAGIRAYGSGHVIEGNTVDRSGREGIKINGATRLKVVHNLIRDAMLQTQDGGGIYSYGTDGGGTEIGHNVIEGVHTGGWGGAGIMLDNFSSNYLVHHNATFDVDHGLKMNSPNRNSKILNNTLVGTRSAVASSGSRDMAGTVFKNNIFVGAVEIGPRATQQNNMTGADARLVNPNGGNLQLRGDSPAVNRGVSVDPVTSGYVGSAPDIGAFEHGRAPFRAGSTLPNSPRWVPPEAGGGGNPAPTPVPTPRPPPPPPSPAPKPGAKRSAKVRIEAEGFSSAQGVHKARTMIGHATDGDWVRFGGVDFGAGGLRTFRARLAVGKNAGGGKVEIRLGGPTGRRVGTLTTWSTGGWDSKRMATQSAGVDAGVAGVQDVYLVFRGRNGGGIANVDWVTFA